ncbi:SCP2 sterol-binding domain-containing protein [Ekhidna sp.]|uniref:SCP2 sterol-binding domain-containing protein n=1 Tax=Ekhidna sp. TaxID=2608089 RepID=UPI003CCBA411
MTLEEISDKIKKLADKHSGQFQGKANFKFEEGVVHLDDTVSPTVVVNEERDAPFAIKMTAENFNKILTGDLNVMMAFMSGKLKIEGDKGAAMKLTALF